MGEVSLSIGGRQHLVTTRDGEEERLRTLGRMLDERWPTAQRAAGAAGGERAMLFVALMLADDLDDTLTNPPGGGVSDAGLVRLAERLEALAGTLEQTTLERTGLEKAGPSA